MTDDITLQDDVKEEIEKADSEDFFVSYGLGQSGEQKTEFIEKWFPKEDDWKGKTDIGPSQARNLALLRNLHLAFDEIQGLADFLTLTADDYEQYLTSVDGKAREQHVRIMRAMFGADTDMENTQGLMNQLLAGHIDDNDE